MTGINDLYTAGQYFLTITAELIVLFIGISFLVGLIQEYVPEEKIRQALTSRHPVVGAILGAIFGALTPFCSCSTIPVLVGLLRTRVPFGACMSYLFASPLLNPVIVFMLLALFGLVPTAIYGVVTFAIAVLAGLLLEQRGYLRYVKPTATGAGGAAMPVIGGCSCGAAPAPAPVSGCCPETGEAPSAPARGGCGCSGPVVPASPPPTCCPGSSDPMPAPTASCCFAGADATPSPASACCSGSAGTVAAQASSCCPGGEALAPATDHRARLGSALRFALGLFRQVVPYLILGAGIGAFIYGFVPEDLIVLLAGPDNPLAIPIAAVIGVPMYIRAETIIPISAVLAAKGMGIGAVIALIIGGAGASIPEVTLLASIFQRRLVVAFVATVLGVAIITGVLMQLLQSAGLFAFT